MRLFWDTGLRDYGTAGLRDGRTMTVDYDDDCLDGGWLFGGVGLRDAGLRDGRTMTVDYDC